MANRSGVVIITVLWILVILSFLSLSLGQSTRIEFSLARNFVGKVKSKYLAWAGIQYAMYQLQNDSADEVAEKFDSLRWCGLKPVADRTVENYFGRHDLDDGYFEVSYLRHVTDGDERPRYFGMIDEERRINLNTVTKNNYLILSTLIQELGYDEDMALTVAHSVIDWRDPDAVPSDPEYGAELEFYEGLNKPYRPKNAALESVEELLLVRGVTPGLFADLREFVTLYPLGGELRINFDTAPELILRSLAMAASGRASGTDHSDAHSLVRKMIEFRSGEDRQENTDDDRIIELDELVLNRRERALFIRMSNLHRARKSNFLRMQVTGVDGSRLVKTNIEAVVGRENMDILYWKRK